MNKSGKLQVTPPRFLKYWPPPSSSHISQTQHPVAANRQGYTSHVGSPTIWQHSEQCLRLGVFSGKLVCGSVCVTALFLRTNVWTDSWEGAGVVGSGKRWALPLRGGGFQLCTLFFDAWQVLHCACVSFRVTAEAKVAIVGRYRGLILCLPFYSAIPSFGLTAVHQPFSILLLWRQPSVAKNKLPFCPSALHPNATGNVYIWGGILGVFDSGVMDGEIPIIYGLRCGIKRQMEFDKRWVKNFIESRASSRITQKNK